MTLLTKLNKRVSIIFLSLLGLLAIPLIAMLFTNEVHWTAFDFLVAGIILTGTGFALELIFTTVKTFRKRFILLVLIAVIFIVVWLELAVGIFGSPFAGS